MSNLDHVRWVGGGSGAGKTTVTRLLAERFGIGLYSTDATISVHSGQLDATGAPLLDRFRRMSMDERWADRSPQTMLETFHWFRGEGFGLIVEDLLQLRPDERLIVEGFRLLPQLVAPLLRDPSQGAWLLPTPEFRRAAFESRGSLWRIAEQTSRPERALSNLLERDRLFTASLQDMAAAACLPVIHVDGSLTEEALESRVATQFGLR